MYTYKQHKDYISLYKDGKFISNCDNWKEVDEEQKTNDKISKINIKQCIDI
jgi:hypothetical protein